MEKNQEVYRAYAPRLSVDLEEEQFNKLLKLIPHGLKRQIFSVIVDDLIEMLESTTKREAVFAAILSRLVNVPRRSIEVLDEPNSPKA